MTSSYNPLILFTLTLFNLYTSITYILAKITTLFIYINILCFKGVKCGKMKQSYWSSKYLQKRYTVLMNTKCYRGCFFFLVPSETLKDFSTFLPLKTQPIVLVMFGEQRSPLKSFKVPPFFS